MMNEPFFFSKLLKEEVSSSLSHMLCRGEMIFTLELLLVTVEYPSDSSGPSRVISSTLVVRSN